ncbi:unnamed protein product [Closterium sp. NIES-54]
MLRCPALPYLSRCPALLCLSRCPALPVASPCSLRAALPYTSRRPARRARTCPARRAALLASRRPALPTRHPAGRAPSCPARTPPCRLPHRPALPAPRPAGHHSALPNPSATLLAAAPPCWPPRHPALPTRSPEGCRASVTTSCTLLTLAQLSYSTQRSLRRPVYGLRQAPHECHDTLRMALAALGFPPSPADSSLFLRTDTSLPPFYILMYIDDLDFGTDVTAALALVKSELQKRHTCTDLSELRSYLGLQITWDRAQRTITLTQSHMVHQVLQRFGFRYSSPQSAPLPTGHSLSAPPSDESIEPSGLYPQLVGCLMYLMTCTRPDLAYPLRILARYVAPGKHRLEH